MHSGNKIYSKRFNQVTWLQGLFLSHPFCLESSDSLTLFRILNLCLLCAHALVPQPLSLIPLPLLRVSLNNESIKFSTYHLCLFCPWEIDKLSIVLWTKINGWARYTEPKVRVFNIWKVALFCKKCHTLAISFPYGIVYVGYRFSDEGKQMPC